ncbi:MAG: homoserine kinase [Rhodospirillaceae bacterium]|nr:homoserine kinase [Rhodospirillaceae bacterium]HAA93512.1 homoserine kinase [Rhodospirillaceae bacterium]|tara:strand:- start:932 stop:1894 length:963 start_codon:yes stop_codon:yes gene_type:complete
MAVYTEVPDDALEDFIADYDIGGILSCKGIAEGVENSNYLLRTDQGQYILTLYEKRVDPKDLPYFLNLMEHLAANEILCPTVLHGRDGVALRELCSRPAAVISFLDGMSPRKIEPDHCAELGNALAKLHLAGADFAMSRKNSLSVDAWRPLLSSCGPDVDDVQPGLSHMLETELDFLEANWPADLATGICHADLFPDNVFFLHGKLSGLIDFYFACNDFLAYDLAVSLNAWCFERDGSFNATKARLLLGNYRKVRSMPTDELAALPILARGSAVRFLLTRLYDWLNHPEGALVQPKDPTEYVRILSFHQQVDGPGEYGID